MIKQILLFGSVLVTLAVSAAQLPPLVLPEGVGVNIRFTEAQPRELDLIAASGCKFVRLDLSWAATEQAPGRYDFSAYDPLVEALRKKGIRVMFVLDCSNPRYGDTVAITNAATGQVRREIAAPVAPRAITFIARWAAAAANHFKGRSVIWEIRSETTSGSGKVQDQVNESAMIVSSACAAMRAVDPTAAVLAPAAAELSWGFMEGFCQSGALGYLHGFSVHPFRSPSSPPESAGADYQKLRALLDRPAPNRGRGRLPIIASEWGYSTARSGVTPEIQADYIVRQQLFNLLHEIPITIWYDWKNDGTDPESNAHNFGLVTRALQPKPAYLALQMMTRELTGYRIDRRVDTGDEKVFVLLMSKPGESEKLAAWTIGAPLTISLAVEAEPGKAAKTSVCDIRGETYLPKVKDGKLSLEISGATQFVALAGLRLLTVPPVAVPEKK